MTFTISCRYCGAATGGIFQHSEWSCPYGVQRQGDPVQGEVTALKRQLESLRAERDRLAKEAEEWRWEYDNVCKFANDFEAQRDRYKAALEKIADPRKRNHTESEPYAEIGCLMNIAFEALKDEPT